MSDSLRLTNLREGDSARVTDLLSTGAMRRRLQDLGIVEGTRVQCTQRSPSGDPTAYAVRGAIIALRSEDARDIIIDRVPQRAAAFQRTRTVAAYKTQHII